jgi:hypothetical protein
MTVCGRVEFKPLLALRLKLEVACWLPKDSRGLFGGRR